MKLRMSRIRVHRCRLQYQFRRWANGLLPWITTTLTAAPEPVDHEDTVTYPGDLKGRRNGE